MYYREYAIVPGQPAVTGALSIFVEGCRHDDVRQQLIGLSVLQSATAEQVQLAMLGVEARDHLDRGEIDALFTR